MKNTGEQSRSKDEREGDQRTGRAEGGRVVTGRSIATDRDETLEALDQEQQMQKMQPQRRWIDGSVTGAKP